MRSLLSADAANRLDGSDGFLFCKTEACEVVYFEGGGGEQFRESDLTVPVFQKSQNPLRLVCYCFEHTAQAVRDDAVRAGTSTIADEIADKCRQGLDRCEQMNPQGSCCLGNVREVAKAAIAETGATSETQETNTDELPACCTPREKP